MVLVDRTNIPCCVLAGIMLLAAGCSRVAENRPSDGRLAVLVGVPPLKYLVEQIGAAHVKVDVLVQPGQDPHTFEPTPQQVVAVGRAAVFFKIDMPFEAMLLENIRQGNRRLEVVDATQGIQKRRIDGSHDDRAAGNARDEASHAGEFDPHVWLSPPLLKKMAANIADGLCRADPAHKREYQQNLAAMDKRLDSLDQRVRKILAPYRGRTFYVFHPGLAYFADAYGLHEEPIEVAGQQPTPKQLRALIEKARGEGAKTVFLQREFTAQSAKVFADALGGQVVTINGLGENVVADIEDIAVKMEQSMRIP